MSTSTYYYTGAPDWVFQMFAFIGFVVSFVPLPWHLEAWNVGTCLYMIWTGLACLVLFVNSIVWQNNIIDWSPTWCDISTHYLNGFNLALPAASLCINRRLYQISSVHAVMKTKAEQRREIIIDLAIGLGLPLLQIPLQYIVQGHRYNIFEDIGCLGETFETPVAVVLYHIPPILVGCVSAIYCTLSIRSFYASRAQFKEFLGSSNANLNLNRYVRLMALASVDLLFTIPMGIWVLYNNVAITGLQKWKSWADTHSNFSRVVQIPGIFWRRDPLTVESLETMRWMTVFSALIFFAFFGFADEAMKNYKRAIRSVGKRVGLSTAESTTVGGAATLSGGTGSKGGDLPSFVRRVSQRKRDSIDSLGVDSFDEKYEKSGPYADPAPPTLSYSQGRSFGALTLQDVGGLLPPPDYHSEIGLSPVESYASSTGSQSFIRADSDDGASLQPTSRSPSIVEVALPEPAHVHVSAHDIV